jgi:proteasome lid subunit RPN8/RPN11
MSAEQEAESLGLDLIGVFHSHPDHPAVASEFDLEWALPWFSYLITAVQHGRARQSRSWRLDDDRTQMCEEAITITPSVIRGENQ